MNRLASFAIFPAVLVRSDSVIEPYTIEPDHEDLRGSIDRTDSPTRPVAGEDTDMFFRDTLPVYQPDFFNMFGPSTVVNQEDDLFGEGMFKNHRKNDEGQPMRMNQETDLFGESMFVAHETINNQEDDLFGEGMFVNRKQAGERDFSMLEIQDTEQQLHAEMESILNMAYSQMEAKKRVHRVDNTEFEQNPETVVADDETYRYSKDMKIDLHVEKPCEMCSEETSSGAHAAGRTFFPNPLTARFKMFGKDIHMLSFMLGFVCMCLAITASFLVLVWIYKRLETGLRDEDELRFREHDLKNTHYVEEFRKFNTVQLE